MPPPEDTAVAFTNFQITRLRAAFRALKTGTTMNAVWELVISELTGSSAHRSNMTNPHATTQAQVGLAGAIVRKGTIASAAGFPAVVAVAAGHLYEVTADVEDSDATKTHTHQLFKKGDKIYWDGSAWKLAGADNTWTENADGTIQVGRLVEYDGTGQIIEATTNSEQVVGALDEGVTKTVGQSSRFIHGAVTQLIAAMDMKAGAPIKASAGGKAIAMLTATLAGGTMKSGVGGNFGNQPASDTISVVSSSVADTTQKCRLIGTTQGGQVVVSEEVSLTGTVAVDSVKANWGLLLGAILDGVCAGTVTIKEKSGGLTICTIAPAALTAGILEPAAADKWAHNRGLRFVADGATTKYIGAEYVDDSGVTQRYCVQLNGATAVPSVGVTARRVAYFLVGDVESTRTATCSRYATADDAALKCGHATAASVEDASSAFFVGR